MPVIVVHHRGGRAIDKEAAGNDKGAIAREGMALSRKSREFKGAITREGANLGRHVHALGGGPPAEGGAGGKGARLGTRLDDHDDYHHIPSPYLYITRTFAG